jgi:hypothetical protein
MKDAIITVRLPRAVRRRIEAAAREEGRSLSQWVSRVLERTAASGKGRGERTRTGSLAGILRGGRVPTLAEFRTVRADLSASLGRGRTKW